MKPIMAILSTDVIGRYSEFSALQSAEYDIKTFIYEYFIYNLSLVYRMTTEPCPGTVRITEQNI